ncbi:PepSY-associated TM helix domain-containing protein [Neptunicella marina]|uniref:PepSY domain-containing protein n=1 Tax=Neptunicella marina TaxID=2125989 RepID=A0A8J6IV32_9ALTE|nr:PepSY-associated TM helix domain-containing protein [Neptunicella marina]MBC3766904.1 PepSY domain-containing protein [Neptunicella marina]
MRFTPSKLFSQQSLKAHAWLGLLTGALMYWVCLSGALAVYYPLLERWEQPDIQEYRTLSDANLQKAYEAANQLSADTHHLFIMLPTEEMQRPSIASDTQSWLINHDGSLGGSKSHPWKDMLVNLHLYLHLPYNIGMLVVSVLGALLCALILSGVIAHRRIFKDAFNLRFKGQAVQTQADIHNRISVWGLPFHLMIGITGAYFGLASLINVFFAEVFYQDDQSKLMADLYGAEPALSQPVSAASIDVAMQNLRELAPQAEPFYVTLEDVGEPEQYMIIGAHFKDRLIYAEQYRFDSQGNYINKVGFSDGSAAKQAMFSIYRLHFGHFGHALVQVMYLLLGLGLSVVSVTGINLWLSKRKGRDFINNAWQGIVWGTPLALVISAIGQILLGIAAVPGFWFSVIASMLMCQLVDKHNLNRSVLQGLTALALVLFLAGYVVKFSAYWSLDFVWPLNALLLLTAIGFWLWSRYSLKRI